MPSIRICTGIGSTAWRNRCCRSARTPSPGKPVYEDMPGLKARSARQLRRAAGAGASVLRRIEQLTEVPIAMVSTGAERDETILLHHPFH